MQIGRYFLILNILVPSMVTMAQDRYFGRVIERQERGLVSLKSKAFKDTLSLKNAVGAEISALHAKSYLLAGIDSVYTLGDTTIFVIEVGEQIKWASLSPGNVNEYYLSKAGYKPRDYRNKYFKYRQINAFNIRMVSYLNDSGYPFAAVKLDSICWTERGLNANLNLNPGPLVFFDSVRVHGETRIKPRFIGRYLRVVKGRVYSDQHVGNIGLRIRQLPYLRQTRDPILEFAEDKVVVNVFLKDRPSNQIDGIVGFLPNEEEEGKLLLTGELNLRLRNVFGSGKTIGVKWQKQKQFSQLLNLDYHHPLIFNSNIDVLLNFDLLKEDTTFLNVRRRATLVYNLPGSGRVSALVDYKNSTLLASTGFENVSSLPEINDYQHLSYGLAYEWNSLDDIFFPRRGLYFHGEGMIGTKNIIKNPFVNQVVYNNIQLRTTQYSFRTTIEKFVQVKRISTFLLRLNGGLLDNPFLLRNDMYRIGGLATLRGFNENFFFANQFAIGTVEYRLFISDDSYLMLFADQGYYQFKVINRFIEDLPRGFGAGFAITTTPGIFTFALSLGSTSTQAVDFGQSKVHFGLVNRF